MGGVGQSDDAVSWEGESMTIAKCKKCGGGIMTPEHLEDKKNLLCAGCILKEFSEEPGGRYLVCNHCGTWVSPRLHNTNIHLSRDCSSYTGGKQ